MLISASHLHLGYGDGRSPILDDESMDAEVSEKIGLVGRNGAGKSSLLKILADPQTTAGKIIRKSGMKTHILEQNPVFTQKTIWQEMKAANDALSDPRDDYELKAILTRLKLDDFDAPIEPLSGGQKRRLSLALTLADRADLLLLDEPTNHLDIEMIEWLENWLSKTKATVITVTHDRRFLEQACTRILELTDGHLYSHPGSYAEYLEAREKREADEQARAAKRENLYRHELEWVRAGVQARSTKQKSRLDRFEELRAQRTSRQNKTMELRFPSERLGKKTLEWQNLSFGYTPEKILFHDFSYHCKRTDRIALVGPNGCGKSTFLNLVDSDLTPLTGAFNFGSTVKIGYFRQIPDPADGNLRVLDYIEKEAKAVVTLDGEQSASAMLERFLFDKTRQYLPLNRLSGGERRRLELVRVLMKAPNVLLLDEPGNDLDIETLEVLEDYLDNFPGIVLFVSHDRFFIDRTATELFELQSDGTFLRISGGYSDLQVFKEEERRQDKARPASAAISARPKEKKISFSSKEKRELEEIPQKLEANTARIEEIDHLLESETDYKKVAELSDEREALSQTNEQLEERWMELEEKREETAKLYAAKK